MRAVLLLALLGSGILAMPVAAATACLDAEQPIVGVLEEATGRLATGDRVTRLHLVFDRPTCVMVTGLDGAPERFKGVRKIEIAAVDRTAESALGRLLSSKVRLTGELDAADPDRHIGTVVLANAELVSVGGVSDDTSSAGVSGADEETAEGSLARRENFDDTEDATAGPAPRRHFREVEPELARFVEEFYLSGEDVAPDVIRAIYADRVSYFGKSGVSLDRIVKDKLAYYRRWPKRRFALLPGTLDIRRLGYDGKIYDVSFVYDFRVERRQQAKSGRGYARLTIDLGDRHGKIVRESGKVIDRN